MIQVGTLLAISDNSGAKKAKCIKILKKTKKNMGQVGDLIVVSLQETNPKK
jgi:large subunit ribosomal protein L14